MFLSRLKNIIFGLSSFMPDSWKQVQQASLTEFINTFLQLEVIQKRNHIILGWGGGKEKVI